MLRSLLIFALALFAFTARAQEGEKVKIDDEARKSIDRALAWLKTQQKDNGSWSDSGNTGITSFALMSFLANGHVPNQGLYGPEVAKGIRYLLAVTQDSGYIVAPGGNNGNHGMYSHGMATLVLSQVFGMTADPEVRKVLVRAVALIVKSQNQEGGWRYQPQPADADISVTIMQVMALRGAKDSGLNVPDEVMKKAVAYIERCRDRNSGGYKYQTGGGDPGYARTAAGVCVLQLTGNYDAKTIRDAVTYMVDTRDDKTHYWYGHYYASHAFHQLGGEKWVEYYGRMKAKLLKTQKPTGNWNEPFEQNYGMVYQTSIAVLILSVPADFLPIYQR